MNLVYLILQLSLSPKLGRFKTKWPTHPTVNAELGVKAGEKQKVSPGVSAVFKLKSSVLELSSRH